MLTAQLDELLYYRTRQIRYTGPPMPPDPYEMGWKDTSTRIRNDYPHHREIRRLHGPLCVALPYLEHEDNEMMRGPIKSCHGLRGRPDSVSLGTGLISWTQSREGL